MKFRRCMVRQKLGAWAGLGEKRYAWVPVDRAALGERIKLKFGDDKEGEFEIFAMDSLVVDGKYLAYFESAP